jgi:hypothetical protein
MVQPDWNWREARETTVQIEFTLGEVMALYLMVPSFRRALAASKVESPRGAATKEQATAILDSRMN